MGLAKMIGSTVVTLGIIGAGLQLTGAYDVNNNVVKPVVETVKEDNYSGLKELKLVDFKDTNYIWANMSKEQKAEVTKRGIISLSLEERAKIVKEEWQKIPQPAKYGIIKAELEAMLEQFYNGK